MIKKREVIDLYREYLLQEANKLKDGETLSASLTSEQLRVVLLDKVDNHYVISPKMFPILNKLELSGMSLKDVDIHDIDFSKIKGLIINPQEIYDKNLSGTTLEGIKFTGSFNDVDICGANFKGSVGAKINPQTIRGKNLTETVCTNIEFIGNFDDVIVSCADFTGSINARINPQTIKNKDLTETNCHSVEFIGSFEDVEIEYAEFEGSNYEQVKHFKKEVYAFQEEVKSIFKDVTHYNIKYGSKEKYIEIITKLLDKYQIQEPVILPLQKEVLDALLFEGFSLPTIKKYREFNKRIDFSNVSFDDKYVYGTNFAELKGVKINPQKVRGHTIYRCTCKGVEFTGPFDGIIIDEIDFTGSKGAKIDPQTVNEKSLYRSNFADVEFIGSFDGTFINRVKFKGSKGAKIDPQNLRKKILHDIDFADVEFIDNFDGVNMGNVNFTGSKGARINPQTIDDKFFSRINLCDTEITGSFDDTRLFAVKFGGSKGAKINPQKLYYLDLEHCDLKDVVITGGLKGVNIEGTDFTGSVGGIMDCQQVITNLRNFRMFQTIYNGLQFYGEYERLLDANIDLSGTNLEELKTPHKNSQKVIDQFIEEATEKLQNPNYDKETRQTILVLLIQKYRINEHVKLLIDNEILREILFDEKTDKEGSTYLKPSYCFEFLLPRLDLSEISFDNVDIRNINFKGCKGVKVNPQTLYSKELVGQKFNGVEFIGPFDGAHIARSDFTGSKGAIINPQTLDYENLYLTVCCDVEFIGSFDNAQIIGTDFRGHKGTVIINPQTIKKKSMQNTILEGVTFKGSFDDVYISGANFKGSTGAIIDPQTIDKKNMEDCVCEGVHFTNTFENVRIKKANFDGSNYNDLKIGKKPKTLIKE